MLSDKKKVAIVGVGMVGMSFAYALLNQNICDELVLIDINKERAWGEAADLSHGRPLAQFHEDQSRGVQRLQRRRSGCDLCRCAPAAR